MAGKRAVSQGRRGTFQRGLGVKRAVWLAGFALAFLFPSGLVLFTLGRRHALEPRLNRAADMLTQQRVGSPSQVPVRAEEALLQVPASVRFDREVAVERAMELLRLRRQVVRRLRGSVGEQEALDSAAAAAEYLRGRLASFLKTDDTAALVVLYSLGWPWVGSEPLHTRPARLEDTGWTAPPPPRPILDAVLQAPAWPAARRKLLDEFGLTGEQAFAIRCGIARQAVGNALIHAAGRPQAIDALARYAALAPAQAETVLAMAGTLYLARRPDAEAILERLSRDHAELVEPIRRFRSERER